MLLTVNDVAALKGQLGGFTLSKRLEAALLPQDSPLANYLRAWPLASLPAQAYHLGYFEAPNVLTQWRKVAVHAWRAQQPRATVCFAPGLFDHAGLFVPFFGHLLQQQFNVICLEMPGHGLSPGVDCAIERFEIYGAIWQAFWNAHGQHFEGPLLGVGQSTGCAALTAWLFNPTAGEKPHRLAYVAPLVRPYPWWKVRLLTWLLGGLLARVKRHSPAHSHSLEFNGLMQQDVLQSRYLSALWAKALLRWVAHFSELSHSAVPLAVFQGTGDRVVDWRFNLKALQQHFSAMHSVFFSGAYHHLLNESLVYRMDVYEQISAFLGQGLGKTTATAKDSLK